MKKLVVCLLFMLALSCSTDDGMDPVSFVILPVEDAIVPTEFERYETYDIYLEYLRPTSCHGFNDIYYTRETNERTVAIVAKYFQSNNNCVEIDEPTEASFRFKATTEDLYIFKFWQGEDENGEDQYMIIEVPVID
ncbi:hypothetical protein [Hanstruepera ponticola]|uniref:hypothetical protein n=1 Tax=Hanstruepera ponticola TaxID=2042995 RepID=UPI000CF08457|nr:hypothetical protein [Hanstruepera ponticola]